MLQIATVANGKCCKLQVLQTASVAITRQIPFVFLCRIKVWLTYVHFISCNSIFWPAWIPKYICKISLWDKNHIFNWQVVPWHNLLSSKLNLFWLNDSKFPQNFLYDSTSSLQRKYHRALYNENSKQVRVELSQTWMKLKLKYN